MRTERCDASCTCTSSWPTRYRYNASSVTAPIPRQARVNTMTWPTSRRTRSDQVRRALTGRLEDIAGAAQRMDHGLAPVVDLLPQVRDVQLDDVGPTTEVVTPHPVQDLRFAQHPLSVAHHEPQQLELGGGQRDRFAGAGDLVAVLVEHQVADDDLRAAVHRRHPGAP